MLAVAGVIVVTGVVLVADPAGATTVADPAVDVDLIPEHVAEVYEYAAATAWCQISFATLAGVGEVTSDHTRVGGDPRLLPDGASEPTILYEQLDPSAPTGRVADTDGGAIDGLVDADITVGPLQFLPATWTEFGVDGNGDGVADPNNLWDAAAGAANRLCDASVDSDLDGALTAYFGTDAHNDWVLESIAAAAEWQLAAMPTPARREVDVVGVQTAASLVGSALEQVPAGPGQPTLIGPPPPSASPASPVVARGSAEVSGDWDGDGAPDAATLVADGEAVAIRRTDGLGRPYGRTIDVSYELGEPGVLGGLVVGEWDGDGIDDLALVVSSADGVQVQRFDRAGNVIDVSELGLLGADDTITVGPAPVSALSLGDEQQWRTVTAYDGTVLDLWKVGGIVVEAAMVEQTSAMLASAAADGITLQGWGWRSHDAQIELRRAHCADVWTTPASECSPPTAIPGTSRHEYGTAIDFHDGTESLSASSPAFAWLSEHASEFGFYNLPSEPWHWSVDGG